MSNQDSSEQFKQYYPLFEQDIRNESVTRNSEVDEIIEKTNNIITEKEEEQKRSLREKSFKLISGLIWFQLVFFNIIVFLILASVVFNFPVFNSLDKEATSILLDFLKYFIGATIVELLGMLSFVIGFVFSRYRSPKT